MNFRNDRRVVDGFAAGEIVPPLNAGIVKDTIEARKFIDDFPRGASYGGEIRNIHWEVPHPGIFGANTPQSIFTATADNDLIPQLMECFRETPPNA